MARSKPTVVSIVGARPQFIKLAPTAARLKTICRHIIIHSGQHYDYEMSQVFFDQLHIPAPDMNLDVGSGSHGYQTARTLERCEKALMTIKPDMVIVYGDTNTTLAGALAAAKLHIPVAHVEAGLRSFRMDMPEEINRRLTDHLSTLMFYPTATARKNLTNEGLIKGVVKSGDVMYEILAASKPLIEKPSGAMDELKVIPDDYVLVTLHRAENVDDKNRLRQFVDLVKSLPMTKVFLAHPRTVKALINTGLINKLKGGDDMIISSPRPYIETLTLVKHARAVMTDSGGLQKEACFLQRPCLTMRPETEWVETVETGANVLIDMSIEKAQRALRRKRGDHRKPAVTVGGRAPSEIIAKTIDTFLRSG